MRNAIGPPDASSIANRARFAQPTRLRCAKLRAPARTELGIGLPAFDPILPPGAAPSSCCPSSAQLSRRGAPSAAFSRRDSVTSRRHSSRIRLTAARCSSDNCSSSRSCASARSAVSGLLNACWSVRDASPSANCARTRRSSRAEISLSLSYRRHLADGLVVRLALGDQGSNEPLGIDAGQELRNEIPRLRRGRGRFGHLERTAAWAVQLPRRYAPSNFRP